jgi:hypothetical protein
VFIWTLSIVRYPKNIAEHEVSETGCVLPQVRGESPTLLGPLARTNLNADCSFRNPDDGQSPECYTPSSEAFTIYMILMAYTKLYALISLYEI